MTSKAKKTKTFRSLWVTLAIAFLSLSAVVLLIASSSNLYLSLRNQHQLITDEQRFTAQNAANTVKGFIQGKLSELNAAVHLGKMANVRQEEQKTVLEQLIGFEPAFRQLVLLNAQNQEIAKVSRLSSLVSYGFIKRVSDDTFSYIRHGKTYIGSVYIDEITSEPMVIIAVPAADMFGDIKGILLAEVNLKFMWDLVGGIKIGEKGTAYVVDKQGRIIASGDISRVLKGENVAYLEEICRFIKGDVLTHTDNARIVKGIQGNLVVSNHAHLGMPDWAVVVELPILEAYKTVITTLITSGLIMFLSFALAIIAGIYLSKRITKPIISLRDAAIKIGEGRLETRIEISKNDEIGILAKSFNRMAEDLGKTTTSIVNLNREISVRKKVEASLRSSEKRFGEVAENSGEWIWEIDAEGLYTYSSPVVEKLLGYRPQEIVGKKYFYDFLATDVKEELKKAAFEVFARQERFNGFVNPNIHKKGNTVILETHGTPVVDDEGNLCGYRGADRDITERKMAEKSLEKLNKDLESTVTLLTQSNKQLREFAHLAAHDIKTPLRGISTIAQWLVDDYRGKFDDKGRHQVDLLIKRVEQINELVNAILQYSTITREKHRERPTDLNALIEKILVGINPPANIKITINKEMPTLIGKETHFQQLFYHLLTNAIKFMDKPQGQITVDCTDKYDFFEFSVSDNGPGIERQHYERIFQLFQMLIGRDQSEGIGVGLTFARKIVELYGGEIWLTSELGRGSTFFFTLPKTLSVANNEELLLPASS